MCHLVTQPPQPPSPSGWHDNFQFTENMTFERLLRWNLVQKWHLTFWLTPVPLPLCHLVTLSSIPPPGPFRVSRIIWIAPEPQFLRYCWTVQVPVRQPLKVENHCCPLLNNQNLSDLEHVWHKRIVLPISKRFFLQTISRKVWILFFTSHFWCLSNPTHIHSN